jgi:S-DNA-T family DNA segregation ATPase FtsK/SpoIIIE
VIGIVLITAALLILLSLISFLPSDPVFFVGHDEGTVQAHNFIGKAGATVAAFCFWLIGGAAYLLPFLLAIVGWRCFSVGTLSVTLQSAGGSILALWCLSGLLHLDVSFIPTFTSGMVFEHQAGGVAGDAIAGGLSGLFAKIGAHILLLSVLLIALLVATPLSVSGVTERVIQRMPEWWAQAREVALALKPERWPWERAPEDDRSNKRLKPKPVKINRGAESEGAKARTAVGSTKATALSRALVPSDDGKDDGIPIVLPTVSMKGYVLPDPRKLLSDPEQPTDQVTDDELKAQSDVLTRALQSFGVEGKVIEVHPGPVVTMYEFEPAPGVKVARIVNLADDVALALKAISLRIVAPIPGKSVVGIEVPNRCRETVSLKEVLISDGFTKSRSKLVLALGKDIFGGAVTADLKTMPHLLVAGATGAGKSVGLNTMLLSILFSARPDEVKLLLIDPKMLELQAYDGIPHLLRPVITDAKSAARGLGWVVQEMERRYKLLSEAGVRNIDSYNRKVAEAQGVVKKGSAKHDPRQAELPIEFLSEEDRLSAGESVAGVVTVDPMANGPMPGLSKTVTVASGTPPESLPYIVVMIDELADLMMVAPKDVEEKIARLAQMARASGIHLVLATQRPSVDVLTGLIKANFPARIAYQVSSKTDSRTILDANGAEALLGRGDMLYMASGTGKLMRIHGAFVPDDDVREVVDYVKKQAEPKYSEELQNIGTQDEVVEEQKKDEVYEQAKDLVLTSGQASASLIQRRLRVGYPRAARMIEQMQEEGVVSAPARDGRREVLGRRGPVGGDEA